jgi:ribose/xylose/arabinose/galactoside ABC-type transport system permease subunit
MLLATTGFIWSWLSHSYSSQNPLWSFLITAFLAWRVSRGGRLSRMILIIGNGASCAVTVLAVARLWDLTVMVLIIICAAQVALLVSPPVYGRTRRPVPIPALAPGWAQLVRQPPAWLLPWGLLAGALLTLAFLGNTHGVAIAGCRPAASGVCSALAEGYPLRWLTAYQNEPVISKGALLKDCAQWALASTSVLYLVWLRLTAPADLSE